MKTHFRNSVESIFSGIEATVVAVAAAAAAAAAATVGGGSCCSLVSSDNFFKIDFKLRRSGVSLDSFDECNGLDVNTGAVRRSFFGRI